MGQSQQPNRVDDRSRLSRRVVLGRCADGFAALALAGLWEQESAQAALSSESGLPQNKLPHYLPKAKQVIFLFMSGGPSHVDLFDPKPELARLSGQPLPFKKPKLMHSPTGGLLPSPFKFKKYGAAGIDVSELFPTVASCADDLCVIRSMVADNINHNGACLQMNTGEQTFSRPSLGSWLLYGLGSENRNLPGFVVISPSRPAQGAPLWSSSFLPPEYQGTCISDVLKPIENLQNAKFGSDLQQRQLNLMNQLNDIHHESRAHQPELAARIASFELAFRMQMCAPEAMDITQESKATFKLYGVGEPVTDDFGKQCLLARRLVERGVRFVQLYHTRSSTRAGCNIWDHHSGVRQGLIDNTAATDVPIAGLLIDLKSRGLLNDTLVIWGGEFGRTPTIEGKDGRGHHPFGFTMWMAGGGVKAGWIHGATDEVGWHAVEDRVHVHDLHATILHLLGIDHEKLTFRQNGRAFRLTDIYGEVQHSIIN